MGHIFTAVAEVSAPESKRDTKRSNQTAAPQPGSVASQIGLLHRRSYKARLL